MEACRASSIKHQASTCKRQKAHMTSLMQQAIGRLQTNFRGRLDGQYQREGVSWMLSRELEGQPGVPKGGILADDMGLGKTIQSIATMCANPQPTLIISLVSVLSQWRDAVIQHSTYRPTIINPSFGGLIPSPESMQVAIVTYSVFQRSCKAASGLLSHKWGRIILDEGHTIRNTTTRLFKELDKFNADIKWILTGTPIQNSKKDLITLARWIGDLTGNIDVIVDTLFLRRTQDDQSAISPRLALPSLQTHVVKLEFSDDKERKLYDDIEAFYFAKAAKASTNQTMEAIIRCRQFCMHPKVYTDAVLGGKKRKRVGAPVPEDDTLCNSSKLTYLLNAISNTKEKVLIFCTWTAEMKLIQNALIKNDISSLIYDGSLSRDNKEAVIYNFKNAPIQVLILQINCGSTGLNLQCASQVYITSPHWNPCVELQAIGRAYRKGQTSIVKCYRLAMANSIELRCTEIQNTKIQCIREFINDDSLRTRLGTEQVDELLESLDRTEFKGSEGNESCEGCEGFEDMPDF